MDQIMFIGYQEGYADIPAFPLFDILIPTHELYKSTVGIETLNKLGLTPPDYPTYNEIKGEIKC